MSEFSMPSVASSTRTPGTWRRWVAIASGILTIGALVYLPVWQVLIAVTSSAALEDLGFAGFTLTLFTASLVALIAGLVNRHEPVGHGILRLPRSAWGLTSVGLAALFVPSVLVATGNGLTDFLMRWGITGESALYAWLSGAAGTATLISSVGGLVVAIVALVRKDRSLALVLPIAAGVVVLLFIFGELVIGH